MLVERKQYEEAKVHVGLERRSSFMKQFIIGYEDGKALMDIEAIDKRIEMASNFIAKYPASEILIVCKLNVGKHAASKFAEATGMRFFEEYLLGMLTNPSLPSYFEPSLLIACDPFFDRVAIKDSFALGIPIVCLCNTNANGCMIDLAIPCNNRNPSSLALVFFLLAREICKKWKRGFAYKLEDFQLK